MTHTRSLTERNHLLVIFFFFSSRRRHTRCSRDWSSDVCSSDLEHRQPDLAVLEAANAGLSGVVIWGLHRDTADIRAIGLPVFSLGHLPTGPQRSEERRVGKECRSRWSPYH